MENSADCAVLKTVWSSVGALAVVKSDGCRKEGPVIPSLHTLWVKQSVTEGAL